jgi:hypothetical protein
MSGTPWETSELLRECGDRGIYLSPTGDGGLAVDAPQAALTPELLARLKVHKTELLAMLWPAAESPKTLLPLAAGDATLKPLCQCGSTAWLDLPIHGGRSTRRDCACCGRFLDFPIWYGNDTLQSEQ